jgi:hypothetical protein
MPIATAEPLSDARFQCVLSCRTQARYWQRTAAPQQTTTYNEEDTPFSDTFTFAACITVASLFKLRNE